MMRIHNKLGLRHAARLRSIKIKQLSIVGVPRLSRGRHINKSYYRVAIAYADRCFAVKSIRYLFYWSKGGSARERIIPGMQIAFESNIPFSIAAHGRRHPRSIIYERDLYESKIKLDQKERDDAKVRANLLPRVLRCNPIHGRRAHHFFRLD